MTDLASLVLAIDSSQVKKGAVSLDQLTAAGARTEGQIDRMSAAQFRAVQGIEAFARQTHKLSAQSNTATAAGARMARSVTGVGAASGLARHHMANLGFQVNDVVQGFAMGQRPMQIFMQQGFQIGQIAGQAGIGIGGLAKAVLRLLSPFAGIAAAAAGVAAALKGVKDAAGSDSELKEFAKTLGLTKQELKDLDDVTVTWGDTMAATFDVLAERAGSSTAEIKGAWADAMKFLGDFGKFSVAVLLGAFAGLVKGVGSAFVNLGKIVVNAISGAANTAIEIFEGMLNKIIGGINAVAGFFGMGQLGAANLGRVEGKFDLSNPLADAKDQMFQTFDDVMGGFDSISDRATERAQDRLRKQADEIIDDRPDKKGKKPKKPKKAKEDPIAKEIAQINQQVAALHRLATAYGVSDAAALKAEALSKAEEKALRLKTDATKFYAKELELLAMQRAVDGARALGDLRFETEARKRLNDAVSAGIMTAEEAAQQLELESNLRPLVAAAAVAEGDAKVALDRIIRDLTGAQRESNAELARENALREIAANDNQADRLRLETQLIGASNRERAVALAQLEAIQRLQEMPGLSPAEQQRFIQSHVDAATAGLMTPLQQWAATVPQTAEAVTEALQGIQARGFDSLADAITDVIMGTKSLMDAFRDMAQQIIADIIQMTVRMLIFRAISGMFGGGSTTIQPVANGTMMIQNAKGNIFAGGNVVPFARGGIVDMPMLFPMRGGRTGLMGEAGPEAIMPLARDGSGRLGVRANDNAGGPIEVVVHVDASPDLMVKTAVVADGVYRRNEPGTIRKSAGATVRALSRPKLMGRR